MKKVVIIGAGQLGSRHLQGIAQSEIEIDIEIVEPFETSRKTAEERYYEIENRNNINSINFYSSIDELADNLDLVIVATGANVRFKVISELLEKKNVENLVLEKVLFQHIEEYEKTEKLLRDTNTKCWVNHPRRMFPVYAKLKELLKGSKQISYNFQGGNWGLGCNGLHFIDHLSFLVNSTNIKINNSQLDNKIYESWREGFVEFNGLLSGKIDNHIFSIYSNAESAPLLLTIVSDKLVAKFFEEEGKIELQLKENDWQKELIEEKIIYFQSELSQVIVSNLLMNKSTLLPTYKESQELHIPFISSLIEHMNKIDKEEHKICPIT
jgi:predicted dehydrogenase